MARPMPKFTKTPPDLVAAFDAATPDHPAVVRKTMFGYPALFVNGNMFAFTFGPRVAVRADDARATSTGFEIMPGRPMRGYVEVPASATKGGPLKRYVAEAFARAQAMPPKADAKKVAVKTAAKQSTKTVAKRPTKSPAKKTR